MSGNGFGLTSDHSGGRKGGGGKLKGKGKGEGDPRPVASLKKKASPFGKGSGRSEIGRDKGEFLDAWEINSRPKGGRLHEGSKRFERGPR